jgi:hypothetical protein
LDGA